MKHLLILSLLISGCAVAPVPTTPPGSAQVTWEHRQVQLAEMQQWRLSGRLSITTDIEAWHLDVNWQQQDDQYDIRLSGPLGAGQVRLSGSQAGVYLHDDDKVYFSQEADSLLREHTGVSMPVTSLMYWVRGLPNPHMPDVNVSQLDEYGRLANLKQDGWVVEMKRYVKVNNLQLPNKLFIKGQPDIEVRMIVDDWQLSSSL
ncbi:MAG: lipoprotein insertase outer membrane protein LolB [Gammaproteobacteria bacterium]|nr:lipoprotein insertase outer membrane protein LolB [Gammaproteobacteria bacterium]